jgi:hypothetical protein
MSEDGWSRARTTGLLTERYTFRPWHGDLLRGWDADPAPFLDDATPVRLDAVVVPNHLHPDRLRFACDLTRKLGCQLLVMCMDSTADSVVACLRQRHQADALVLALPWPAEMPLTGLITPERVGRRSRRHCDVAAKRNIGLGVARLMNWRHVLFLDDDVRGLRIRQLRTAVRNLAARPAVQAAAWSCDRFPDNSVVCHARRLVGRYQGVFVGGGALLVDSTTDLPMFPTVYNEDWLFLFDLIRTDALRLAGKAVQLTINPFGDPGRALDEEFGDLLGEGLMHLLHHGLELRAAFDEDYWRQVLQTRREMLADLTAMLATPEGAELPVHRARAARASLRLAEVERTDDLAAQLAWFVRAWRVDGEVWAEWFAKLQPEGTRKDPVRDLRHALERLTIPTDVLITG